MKLELSDSLSFSILSLIQVVLVMRILIIVIEASTMRKCYRKQRPLTRLQKGRWFYQNFSSYLLKKKQRLGNLKKQKDGVELKVENIVFHDENLFFVLRIENDSPIDYEPAFMNISVATRKQGKNTSIQKLVQKPIFKFRVHDKISKGKTVRFVYVLPKFSISEDRQVVIDLKEENGERDVQLKIKKKFINNPN